MRLIVRRVKPTPGSQLALFAIYSYHGFITDRDGETLELEADHRRHAEVENAIRDLKYGVGLNHMPSGCFAANGAWMAVQVMAHNLARWRARIGLGEQIVTTKTLRRRVFALAGRLTRSARRLTLHLPQRWPWENPVQSRPGPAGEPFHSQPDGARPPVPQRPRQLAPVRSASASCRVLSRHLAHHSHCRPPSAPPKLPADRRQPLIYQNSSPDHPRLLLPLTPSSVLTPSIPVHRWIRVYLFAVLFGIGQSCEVPTFPIASTAVTSLRAVFTAGKTWATASVWEWRPCAPEFCGTLRVTMRRRCSCHLGLA